ncbi:LOW QUALITY PROTEIN: uncharacterized protein ACN427_013749 [Glossina fuscipes fuscipes]
MQTATTSTNNGTYERSTSQFQTNIKKLSGTPASHLMCRPTGITTHIARISYECGSSTQWTKTDKSAKDIPPPKEPVSALVYSCQQSKRMSKLQEKFMDKKEKRDRELKEIQKNLNDVNDKNIKSVETTNAEIEAKEGNNMNETKTVTYRRSQTDLEESRKDISHEQTDKIRSKLSQLSITRERSKKTPRKPEGTHRLAAGQKRKYKLHSQLRQEKADKDKSAKEEIKKRLEELQKNTKKLVNKNLEKKKLKAEQTNESVEKKEKHSDETRAEQNTESEKAFLYSNETSESLDWNTKQQNKIAKGHITDRPRPLNRAQVISRSALSLHTNIIWASPKVKSNPLKEEGKRVGLLRKQDNSGENFPSGLRGLDFENENKALETITPNLSTLTEKTGKKCDSEKKKKAIETLSEEESKEPRLRKAIEEKLLKPLDGLLGLGKNNEQNEREVRQVSKAKIEENIGFIKESKKQTKPHNLPYWLRPSSAQVYPYNFILAVRRKLEAITQTPNNHKEQKSNEFRIPENKYISPEEDFECDAAVTRSSLTKPQVLKETVKSKSRSNTENFEFNFSGEQKNHNADNAEISERVEEFLVNLEKPLKSTYDSSPEIVKLTSAEKLKHQKSEVFKISNKFQESLTKPIKFTLDLSPEITKLTFPKEVEVGTHEFDVRLKNSFEALYTENLNSKSSETITNLSSISMQLPLTNTVSEVSSLETESKTTFNKKQGDTKENRPKLASVSPLSVERIELLKIQRTENKNMDKEFSQLLEDFNRSLTQVIQVNEQLKFTLDKSQQLLSPRISKQYTIEYSSDFEPVTEESSEDKAKSEKCQIEKLEQTLKYHKGCLFVTSPKKMPLMSFSDKSQNCFTSTVNANKLLKEEEQKFVPPIDVGVALSNLSNSNCLLTLTDAEDVLENNNSMEFGKRLEFMEKMKRDLTLAIKESQEQRRRVTDGLECVPKSNNSYSNKSKRLSQDSGNDSILKTPKNSPENFDADGEFFFAKEPKDLHISSDNNTQFSGNLNSERKKSPESSAETMTTMTRTTNGDNSEQLIEIFKKRRLTKLSDSSTDGENNGRTEPSCKSQSIDAANEISKTSPNENSNYLQLAANNDNVENDIGEIFCDSGSNKENKTQHCLQSEMLDSIELKPSRHVTSKNPRVPEELPKESWHKGENSKPKTFISHVNCSRGDFMNSNASQRSYSDHQFHPPTLVASHRTSTEFDQSADDEITSSAMSSSRNLTNFAVSSTLKNKVYRRLATGAEIVKLFYLSGQGKYDKIAVSQDTMSESSLNYSNVGLYDKLIQSETTKTEHLTALLKMRERALLDRTKSQIAWLEVQKARYKAKGLVNHIAAIKKKQRGILLKMEKECEEIKRLLQTTSTSSTTIVSSGPIISFSNNSQPPHRHRKEIIITPPTLSPTSKLLRKHNSHSALVQKKNIPKSSRILKGTYELESSKTLENLLRKREDDLRKRRQHVERLLQWHQRLDEEEAEVLHLEEQLLNCNNNNDNGLQTGCKLESTEKLTGVGYEHSDPGPKKSLQTRRSSRARKMERRVIEIDKSLRDLSHISSIGSSTGTNSMAMGQNSDENTASVATIEMEYVRTTGNKLNKLWRRLTSQQLEKYDPARRYKLCKADLEQLYEEAKLAVLREFAHGEERITAELLEKSASNLSSSSSPAINLQETQVSSGDKEPLIVPRLNLNFSSGQSEQDEDSNTTTNTAAGANTQECIYRPSVAEENFKAHQHVLLSTSDTESASTKTQRLERNVQLFLALTKRIVEAHDNGSPELQRSLSDTQLADLTDVAISKKSTTSHKNVASASQRRQSSPASISANKNSRAIHRHSKSSTIELSNIPNINSFTGTEMLENFSAVQQTKVEGITTRSAIICSAVKVTPSAVSTQFESPHRKTQTYHEIPKKSHLSRQLGTSQAQEISVQSNQMSSHAFSAEILSASSDGIGESNISTDQSFSLNFESIAIEEPLSPSNNSGNCCTEDIKKKIVLSNNTTYNIALFDSKKCRRNYCNEEHISKHSSMENCAIDVNGSDWKCEVNDETRMKDMFLPVFDDTVEIVQVEEEELDKQFESLTSASSKDKEDACSTSTTLTPGNYSPEECKELQTNQPLERGRAEILPSPPLLPSQISVVNQIATNNTHQFTAATATQLMPDIINELELRRHQLIIDHEHLRQYEHVAAVPYMYVREIPNKPPPPYVPPAHGSPMTAIFPSEDRIKEITYRRTHELYCELLKTDYSNEKGEHLPSVMDEQITNIYERITLDICREFLEQHSEILRDGDPINFHHQLAFFNPPNRLRCIQNAIYKEVRACLAMDKTQLKRTQVYSVYGQRAKQDHIGKIIIQEMYDEDDRWCTFYREEKEVLELIVEEMINKKTKFEAENILMEEGRKFEKELEENKHEVIGMDGINYSKIQLQSCHINREQPSPTESSSIIVETVKEVDEPSFTNENAKLANHANVEDFKSLDSELEATQLCT